MNKKFLSLVLSLVMVLGTFTSVFAADSKVEAKKEEAKKTSPSAKIQWLVDEKLVEGRKIFKPGEEKNDLALDKNITRAEVTKMLVYAKGQEKLADLVKATSVPYSDVKADHWANGFVTVGTFKITGPKGVAMLAGYPDGTFKPEKNVSYAELAKMLVALVKEDLTPQMVANAQWPGSWLTWAAELGILNGIEYANSNDPATRNLAFQMIYNAMYIYDTRHDVDYGIRIGVVSGYEDGKLVINQGDKQFKVTVDAKTTYVDETGRIGNVGLAIAGKSDAKLFVGSLVEIITDKNEKDGVVSHIIELGNPSVGVKNYESNANRLNRARGWYGVAEKTVQGVADVTKNNITVYDGTWGATYTEDGANVDLNGKTAVKAEFTADTRYFVADEKSGWLTEVDKTKARDLVDVKDGYKVPRVYVGYDIIGKTGRQYNKANIVVFNVVTDDQLSSKIVRVAHVTNRNFELNVENTKGEQTALDMRAFDKWFPGYNRQKDKAGYNDHFEKYDVLEIKANADNKFGKLVAERIDYSEDPIFKVKDVHKSYGQLTAITLEGKDGSRLPKVTIGPRAYQFLEGQLEKDAYIQIDERDLAPATNRFGKEAYTVKNMMIEKGLSIVPLGDKELSNVAGEYVEAWTELDGEIVKVEHVGANTLLTIKDVVYNAKDHSEAAAGERTFVVENDYNATEGERVKLRVSTEDFKNVAKPLARVLEKYKVPEVADTFDNFDLPDENGMAAYVTANTANQAAFTAWGTDLKAKRQQIVDFEAKNYVLDSTSQPKLDSAKEKFNKAATEYNKAIGKTVGGAALTGKPVELLK